MPKASFSRLRLFMATLWSFSVAARTTGRRGWTTLWSGTVWAGVCRARIELRQIGVRDEAKMLGGLGICGRPLCCSQFLDEFIPVSIKMAKTQNDADLPAEEVHGADVAHAVGGVHEALVLGHPACGVLIGGLPKPRRRFYRRRGKGNS